MDRIGEIAESLARLDDERLIGEFLRSVLTPNEVRDVSSRWVKTQGSDAARTGSVKR